MITAILTLVFVLGVIWLAVAFQTFRKALLIFFGLIALSVFAIVAALHS